MLANNCSFIRPFCFIQNRVLAIGWQAADQIQTEKFLLLTTEKTTGLAVRIQNDPLVIGAYLGEEL